MAQSHTPLPPGMAMDVTPPAASADLLAPADSAPTQGGSGATAPVFPRGLPLPEWQQPTPAADPF